MKEKLGYLGDTNIIEQFADTLYRKADRIVQNAMILFGLIGAFLGFAIGATTRSLLASLIIALIGILICGYLGRIYGEMKAFVLRLEAQRALCEVEIEKNTRKTA